jgi:DNA-binding response OmpR family regulator
MRFPIAKRQFGLKFALAQKRQIMDGLVASKKILVVDDDKDIREIIMYILESEGFSVSGLDNGSAVLNKVHELRPDMVLLDVQLGDMDGRDICRELKQEPATQEIPIIMISASHGWHALNEKQCEADDFLAKPFDVNELLNHVKRFAA